MLARYSEPNKYSNVLSRVNYFIPSTLTKSIASLFRNWIKPSIFSLGLFWGKQEQMDDQVKKIAQTKMVAAGYCLSKNARALQEITTNSTEVNNGYDCGEDSFFVDQNNGSFGVADGVGSWSTKGVDPGEIARKLMLNSRDEIAKGQVDPREALNSAYTTIVEKKQVAAGSATACVLNITDGKLNTANLGDSGFIILRPTLNDATEFDIVYKSTEQQLYFNCPKQLSVIPPDTPNAKNYIRNSPKEADKLQFDVQDGDVVIAATDGLFDNVYNTEIVREVSQTCKQIPKGGNYEAEIARRLVIKARRTASDRSVLFTPFSDSAYKNGLVHRGGKLDDITCIVARVVDNQVNRSKL